MPSPAMVNGESTVARIWIVDAKVTCQKLAWAAVTPIARAVKKYIAAVVKWTTKERAAAAVMFPGFPR